MAKEGIASFIEFDIYAGRISFRLLKAYSPLVITSTSPKDDDFLLSIKSANNCTGILPEAIS